MGVRDPGGERAEVAQNLFAEVRVRDQSIVSAKLANDDYLLLAACAEAHRQAGMARPEGNGHPSTTIRIPIVGRADWLRLARSA